jgi:hypothetical protein
MVLAKSLNPLSLGSSALGNVGIIFGKHPVMLVLGK